MKKTPVDAAARGLGSGAVAMSLAVLPPGTLLFPKLFLAELGWEAKNPNALCLINGLNLSL